MVKLINELEQAALVERRRRPNDRRAWEVLITPKGRRALQQAKQLALEVEDEVLSGLTASARRQLQTLLRRALESAPPHPPCAPTKETELVSDHRVPGGVAHELPADLHKALTANATALDAWQDITPLARNEFIRWIENAKQQTTRERRIRCAQEELEEARRRPCCWPGCKHRARTGR